MTTLHIRFLSLLLMCLIASSLGCSSEPSGKNSGESFIADVLSLDLDSVENPGTAPKFKYGPRAFSILTDVNQLSGSGLALFEGGDLEIYSESGSIVTKSMFTGGSRPKLEYRVVDGVVKPTTSKSLAMLSAMYQLDSLLNDLEKMTGESRENVLKQGFDFKVLFEPSAYVNNKGEESRSYETSNAAYVAGSRQFALYKTARSENIPFSFNPQIIAHEFGHAIFEMTFYAGKYGFCSVEPAPRGKLFDGRLELEFIIRGINEGFADFVSFVVSGSANVLEASMGRSSLTQQRNFSELNYKYDDLVAGKNTCTSNLYCLGSIWARTLIETYKGVGLDLKNLQSRQAFLRDVVSALRAAGEKMRANSGQVLPTPSSDLENCTLREKRYGLLDDELLGIFLKSFIEASPADRKATLCAQTVEKFGSRGFANSVRGVCP